jgi:hypothetical protein
MVLTKEDRVALLAKAREAKARKKAVIKEETEEDADEGEETPIVNVEAPVSQPPTPKVKPNKRKNDIVPLPVKPVVIQEPDEEEEVIPKKKTLPVKWLKNPKPTEKVCCKEPLTKEEPLIKDEEPLVVPEKHIVVPSKSTIKKPKAIRASTRTLDMVVEPKPIEEVLEEVKNNDEKYRPQRRLPSLVPPTPQQPISIKYIDPPLRLFDY